MIAALLLIAAPPAVEIAIPNPLESLPPLARFLESAQFADGRLAPSVARSLTEGVVDPLSKKSLDSIGVDLRRPFRLVRPTPDERFLLVADLADAKRFETSLADAITAERASVADGFAVLGTKARWQTLVKRKRNRLYAMRATRSLGVTQIDAKKLVDREKKPMLALIRGTPTKWRVPAGMPRGRDVYITARGVDTVTALDASMTLLDTGPKAAFRFELDAFATTELAAFVGRRAGKRLLAEADTTAIEVWANVPSDGRREVLRRMGAPVAAEAFVTGHIHVVLDVDGSLTLAIECAKDRGKELAEIVAKRYPKASTKVFGRVVVIGFQGAPRALRAKFHKSTDSVGLKVKPEALFASLAARSDASDGAAIDGARLAVFRFAYGGLRKLGRWLTFGASRAGRGFVGHAHLLYAPPR